MSLVKDNPITTDFVLSKVDEAQIFAYYYPGFKLKKPFSSPFRRDKNPSCSFYVGRSGKILFKDWGKSETLDCFAFVGKLNNETYGKAILRVACDFGLVMGDRCGRAGIVLPKIKKAELISEHVKKDTDIQITARKWDREHLAMWKNLSITQEELEREGVYPVDRLYINGKFISNWRNEIRYAYTLRVKDKIYKKIYVPFATEKKIQMDKQHPASHPIRDQYSKVIYQSNFLEKDIDYIKEFERNDIIPPDETPRYCFAGGKPFRPE